MWKLEPTPPSSPQLAQHADAAACPAGMLLVNAFCVLDGTPVCTLPTLFIRTHDSWEPIARDHGRWRSKHSLEKDRPPHEEPTAAKNEKLFS